MFKLKNLGAKALRLIAFPLLLMSGVAWSKTSETLPRYDIRVSVRPEALSVDTNLTLPRAAEPRKSLQFKLLPSMGTPQVQLIAPKAAGVLTVRKVKEEADKNNPRTRWEIEPAAPFPANQPIWLHITHSGGGGGALVYYVGPEFVIASGINQPWFAQFSPTKILGSLSLDMPSNFLAMASGEKVSERVANGRRITDFSNDQAQQYLN